MYSYKMHNMNFTSVELPHQYKEFVTKQNVTFLLDTGASKTVIPLRSLIDKELLDSIPVEWLMSSFNKKEIEIADGSRIVCYEAQLKSVNVLGFKLKSFNFLVACDIPDEFAILGCDFIEACTHYHTSGCAWNFRSFDSTAYDSIWNSNGISDVRCLFNVVREVLSDRDLTSISDF